MSNEKMVVVSNIGPSAVGYEIPELFITRRWEVNETKTVTEKELKALSASRGGAKLIKDFLCVKDEEFLQGIGYVPEKEYYLTPEDIKQMLLSDPIEILLDALDFAPEGIIENIKTIAVEVKLPDNNKREAILKKTGFNVTNAIVLTEPDADVENTEVEKPQRRVATTNQKYRRVTTE